MSDSNFELFFSETKYQKLVEKRLNSIQNYQMPPTTFTLPSIPEGAVPAFTITLSEGVKFKVSCFYPFKVLLVWNRV